MTLDLHRPDSRLRTAVVLFRALFTMIYVETLIRRIPVDRLCGRLGITFVGFAAPLEAACLLPRDLPGRWWAVETLLRRWPFGRDRACLRRSLVLGHSLAHLDPALCLEIITLEPFVAHAWLQVRGQRLDMGVTGPMLSQARAGAA